MTTKLLISGKNWKLSLSEIASYFTAREMKFDIEFFSKEFFAINTELNNAEPRIEDLGGTIKIGDTKAKFPTQEVREAFNGRNKQAQSQIAEFLISSSIIDEMSKSDGKMLFGVSVYCSENSLRQLSPIIQRFVGVR